MSRNSQPGFKGTQKKYGKNSKNIEHSSSYGEKFKDSWKIQYENNNENEGEKPTHNPSNLYVNFVSTV